MGKRLLIIGVDGATFDVINAMTAEGRLPAFSSFMKEGSHGLLASTVPVLSPVAWTTFSTGVSPAGHGIFDFLCRKAGTYDLYYASSVDRHFKPFWQGLSDSGKKVVVMDVPATFPPDPVNGIMVSGEPSPFESPERVHPRPLYKEIISKFGPEVFKVYTKRKNVTMETFAGILDRKKALARFLLEQDGWDVGVIVFTITDIVQHFFWKNFDPSHPGYSPWRGGPMDPVREIYSRMDSVIEELVGSAGRDTNVIIVSDHGFSSLSETFSLTKWLHDQGYLRFKDNGAMSRLMETASGAARFAKAMLGKGGPPKVNLDSIDWARTRAYFVGVAGSIFINLKGREPEGIVSASEYPALLEEIAVKLKGIRGSNGTQPVQAVYRTSEIYPTVNGGFAPDLLVSWNKGFDVAREGCPAKSRVSPLGKILDLVKPPVWTGTHHRDGVMLMKGPDIRKGVCEGANIADIAPTVYYLADAPVPDGIDGKVLTGSISEGLLRTRALKRGGNEPKNGESGYKQTEEDLQHIKNSLKGLGYLE